MTQTEDILRRFTRSSVQHPVYRALAELGKAQKTTFLCRYLGSLGLRREINEGLNVIENWNSANDFIFFGKGGEMASNRADDQEISMLALHLLQLSLVYINTLMIKQVLAEPAWAGPPEHAGPPGHHAADLQATSIPTAACCWICTRACPSTRHASALNPSAPNCCSATINSQGESYFAAHDTNVGLGPSTLRGSAFGAQGAFP